MIGNRQQHRDDKGRWVLEVLAHGAIEALQLVALRQARQPRIHAQQLAWPRGQSGPRSYAQREEHAHDPCAQITKGLWCQADGHGRQAHDHKKPQGAIDHHRHEGVSALGRVLTHDEHRFDDIAAGQAGHHEVEEHTQEGQARAIPQRRAYTDRC